jgi:hypothetical protein
MAVPIRLLWNLQITGAEKAGLGLIFTVGILTMIAAIIRVISLDSSVQAGQVNSTWLVLWAAIEGAVGMFTSHLSHSNLILLPTHSPYLPYLLSESTPCPYMLMNPSHAKQQ